MRLTDRSVTTTVGAFLLSAVLATGCSTPATDDRGVEAPTPLPEGIPSAPAPTPAASQAGPLQQSDLPAPEDLGDGWDYRIDPGSVEDGYAGSGAPAIARAPQDVVAAITPLGCRPVDLPRPVHALEVTYKRFETPGVALLLEFRDASEAQAFFRRHTGVLRECTESKQIEVAIDLDEADAFISERTEKTGASLTWTEGITHRDSQVLLMAIGDNGERATVANALGAS